jgi:hypothetical protein
MTVLAKSGHSLAPNLSAVKFTFGQELLFVDQEKLGSRRAKFNKISQESASLNEMKGRSVNANFWNRALI